MARAAVPLVPWASRLPFVPGGGGDLPDIELTLPEVVVDRDHLAAYDRVCGFPLRDTLPATYPQVLALPLHLALMTDGSFPFAPIGIVHLRNAIVQRRPLGAGETLSLTVKPGGTRAHRKGTAFDIVTEARVGRTVVWESTTTALARGRGSEVARDDGPQVDAEALTAVAEWKLPADQGRRYAAVSGDSNPIHLYNATAKLLGFPRAIVHGMWTKARCLAALDRELPEAFAVDVAFKAPILLPARVTFATDGTDFAVRSKRPHLIGTIGEAPKRRAPKKRSSS
jgi:acyl dehydratase